MGREERGGLFGNSLENRMAECCCTHAPALSLYRWLRSVAIVLGRESKRETQFLTGGDTV